jgi:HAD superfamily hydrolase (TIGR01509 family)
MRYDAVLFDLDGTLIDSERLVIEAGLSAFRSLGLPPERAILTTMVGHATPEVEEVLNAHLGRAVTRQAFDEAWNHAVSAAFRAGVPPRPGAEDLLMRLISAGIPRAVATNSRTASAVANIASAGLHRFFADDHIVGRDLVARPKPAPDVFLEAADRLGAAPARCLVFEDSEPGTAAGLAAGMTVVQIPDQRPAETRDAHHLAASLIEGARAAGLID